MRFVRPFEPGLLPAGQATEWLIARDEDLGLAVRICRGGRQDGAFQSEVERFALVLEGEVSLAGRGDQPAAGEGALLFIPAGEACAFQGDAGSVWAEIEAPVGDLDGVAPSTAAVIAVDPTKFEGGGFAYQALIDRSLGASSMRMNVLQVAPGSGSPDFHIHDFVQVYVIQEGEMTLDIGRRRVKAGKNSLVVLPAGLVHRNFNASGDVERHVSLLAPEPRVGEVFDFAVSIHEEEAELLTAIPA